jgi:hypothetical protein
MDDDYIPHLLGTEVARQLETAATTVDLIRRNAGSDKHLPDEIGQRVKMAATGHPSTQAWISIAALTSLSLSLLAQAPAAEYRLANIHPTLP